MSQQALLRESVFASVKKKLDATTWPSAASCATYCNIPATSPFFLFGPFSSQLNQYGRAGVPRPLVPDASAQDDLWCLHGDEADCFCSYVTMAATTNYWMSQLATDYWYDQSGHELPKKKPLILDILHTGQCYHQVYSPGAEPCQSRDNDWSGEKCIVCQRGKWGRSYRSYCGNK